MEDWQQLREYLENGSEAAFAALVNRHLGLVYSVALRKLGNPEDAKEVAQSVFYDLARKARKLRSDTVIVGWLHRAAWLASLHYWRTEHRRRQREQQAALMNTSDPAPENSWQQVAAHLDEALTQMDEQERLGILLRFFQGKSFRQVGETLGVNEDAARMRINRALEKLHALLIRKAVSCPLSVLGALLADQAVQAAPLEITQSVLNALRQAAQAAPTPLASLTLVSLLAKVKLKTALVFGLALLVAIDVGLFVLNRIQEPPAKTTSPLSMPVPRASSKQTSPGLRRVVKPQERSSDLDQAVANLWRALREEPVDANGAVGPDKVCMALRAFGTDTKPAIPVLLEGLRNPDGPNDQVQWCSSMAFSFLGARAAEAVPSLIDLFQSETESRNTRIFAMEALRNIKNGPKPADVTVLDAAVPALIGLLNNGDAGIVQSAVGTLATIGDSAKQAIPAIAELLTNGDAGIVLSATGALGAFGDPAKQTIPAIVELLTYSVPSQQAERLTRNVRIEAARALERMGSEAAVAVPSLIQMLADSDKDVRGRSTIALWKIAGRTDGAAVVAADLYPPWFEDTNWEDLLNALAEMGPAAKAAVPNLQKLCRFVNPDIAPRALAILKKIDPEAAAKVRLLPSQEGTNSPPPAVP
jgi:RNA polymerase sigma factor (sigma-70 family)